MSDLISFDQKTGNFLSPAGFSLYGWPNTSIGFIPEVPDRWNSRLIHVLNWYDLNNPNAKAKYIHSISLGGRCYLKALYYSKTVGQASIDDVIRLCDALILQIGNSPRSEEFLISFSNLHRNFRLNENPMDYAGALVEPTEVDDAELELITTSNIRIKKKIEKGRMHLRGGPDFKCNCTRATCKHGHTLRDLVRKLKEAPYIVGSRTEEEMSFTSPTDDNADEVLATVCKKAESYMRMINADTVPGPMRKCLSSMIKDSSGTADVCALISGVVVYCYLVNNTPTFYIENRVRALKMTITKPVFQPILELQTLKSQGMSATSNFIEAFMDVVDSPQVAISLYTQRTLCTSSHLKVEYSRTMHPMRRWILLMLIWICLTSVFVFNYILIKPVFNLEKDISDLNFQTLKRISRYYERPISLVECNI